MGHPHDHRITCKTLFQPISSPINRWQGPQHDKREGNDAITGFFDINLFTGPLLELPPITPVHLPHNLEQHITHCDSTSANPNPMISPAFVEANYEILESLLRERRKNIHNEDLRAKLEYFSEEYDEEREMELRLVRDKKLLSFSIQGLLELEHRGKRVVEFKNVPNKDGGRVERNFEGERPSEFIREGNRSQGMNLPLLLAAHLGRSENGHSLQSP
ncbi:hypothetical protein Tco_0681996, partial [Tanacetum coccineum]